MEKKVLTPKSETEIQMENLLKNSEKIIDDSYLTIKEARKVLDMGYKLLYKVEELRKSRDKWRNNYHANKN